MVFFIELAVNDPYITSIGVGFDQFDLVKLSQVNVYTLRKTSVFSALQLFK